MLKHFLNFVICFSLISCGFHSQGEVKLAPPLHRLYIQTSDPYSEFIRSLKIHLKMSQVQLVETPQQADTIIVILQDSTSQVLLGVNGTQQTRQYLLLVNISFQINNRIGKTIVPLQAIGDSRVITVQSNQILGSSNEVNLYYKQMRRYLAAAFINRISSNEITKLLNQH